jgi:hypothetical protein
MARTDFGRNLLAQLLTGTGTPVNAANGHLGVGGGAGATTAFAAGQTDLQGASKTRRPLDGAPGLSTNVMTFVATFGTGDGNHAWEEVIVANAASGANAIARVVQALGTKSGGTWVLTHTVTLT